MTYRTLRQGEIVPPNAEFLCEGEWLNTSCAGLLPTAGPEYRVPIDEPTPTTNQETDAASDDATYSRFFKDKDGDIGEQIEANHLTNPMGEIWRRLKYRNGKTSWMPDRILTEIYIYNHE